MPAQGKRSWDASDDLEKGISKDYPVCDQCRSRKIRCGRERPQCSNCTRLGLDCEWLGQGKKPNQTIWLSHAVTRLGDRLEQLESAVSGLQGSLDRCDASSIEAATPPTQGTSISRGRRRSVRNVSGREHYYGSTSFVSLMQDVAAIIQADLCSVEQNAAEVVTAATVAREELLQLIEPCDVYNRISDGSILTSPPLVIIEAMIDPYFEMVDPYMPLWTKEGFRTLMRSAENPQNASRKRAYDVCANNIVLLTLQAKHIHSHASSRVLCTKAPPPSSIDIDLIRSFIINANRALENVELLLLNPSLLSLQALISLCLVSQTSLSEEKTALLFSFAVHVAKAIGLHQWSLATFGEGSNRHELNERRNAIYCMLCLSRATSWSSGWSFTLPSIATFERELLGPGGEQPYINLTARVALLQLEEQVYTGLYSDESCHGGAGEIGKRAINRGRKLHDWELEHCDDLGDEMECHTLSGCSRGELTIRLLSSQVLAAWPIAEDLETSCSLLDVSRRSIRLFRRLWEATLINSHYLNLGLLLASYPPVALFELARHISCNNEVCDEDIELLQFFVNMIHIFAEWAEENSYMNKLSKFGASVWRMASACRESHFMTLEQPISHPSMVEAQINPLGSYQGMVTPTPQMYGAGSVASSSSHTNSTPISGRVQAMPPVVDSDTIPVTATTTSETSSSSRSFHDVFGGEISPMDELDGWLTDSGPEGAIRAPFQPSAIAGLHFEYQNAFLFDGTEFG